MAVIFKFKRNPIKQRIVGKVEGFSQELVIEPSVLKHISVYRQVTPWSNEAGGQLFGYIDDQMVCGIEATGPYPGDERFRHRYRSNSVAAQGAIDNMAQKGLLYLGEWHTHAEDCPSASGMDTDAMHRLIENSRLNSNSLLLLIVGRAPSIDGLAVWSVANKKMHRWKLFEALAGSVRGLSGGDEMSQMMEDTLRYDIAQYRKRIAELEEENRELRKLAQAAVDHTVGVQGCDELEALGDYLEGLK